MVIAIVFALLAPVPATTDETTAVPPPSSVTRIAPARPADAIAVAAVAGGDDVRVNANAATLSRPQSEPSVASSPRKPRRLVAGYHDALAGPAVYDNAPGVARSADGGLSWMAPAGGATLPPPPGFQWGSRALATHLAAGDPAVAWGLADSVYFAILGFHDHRTPPAGVCSAGGLYVYRSDDGGDTWTLPAGGPAFSNSQTVFRDKGYLAVDTAAASAFRGRVYLVWDDDVYEACPQEFPRNFRRRDIVFSSSSDGGATWTTPQVLASGCLVAPVPAVARNGDVLVAWYDCNDGVRQMVRKSIDGGHTFAAAAAAAESLTAPPSPLEGSSFRVGAFPAIATDPTDEDNVYVTWSSDNGPSQTDVFVSRSLDGGETWTLSPARVNDDALDNPRDQFFPWVAVAADGTVRVMWGDDRLDAANPGGKLYDVFLAESRDRAATFSPNVRLTSVSSNPDHDGFGGTFIGDYFGLSASGVAVWADTRSGNQDIFGRGVDDLLFADGFEAGR